MAAQLPIGDIAYESADSTCVILYIVDEQIRREIVESMEIPYSRNTKTFAFYRTDAKIAASAHPDFYSIHITTPVELLVLISEMKEQVVEQIIKLTGVAPTFLTKTEFTEAMYEASRYYVFNSD